MRIRNLFDPGFGMQDGKNSDPQHCTYSTVYHTVWRLLCEEGHFGEAVRLLVGAAGEPDPGPAAQAVRLLTSLLSHHMAAPQQAAALVAAHVIPALRLAAQVLSYF